MASSENNLSGKIRMSTEDKVREDNSPVITSTSNQFSLLAEQYPDSTEDEDEDTETGTQPGGHVTTESTKGRQPGGDVTTESTKGRQPDGNMTEKPEERQSEDIKIDTAKGRQPDEDETTKGRQLPVGETEQHITSSVYIATKSKDGTTTASVSSTVETTPDSGNSKIATNIELISQNVTSKSTECVDIDRISYSSQPPIHSVISSSQNVASDQNILLENENRSANFQTESSLPKKDNISQNFQNVTPAPQIQSSTSSSQNVLPVSKMHGLPPTTGNLAPVPKINNLDPNFQSIAPNLPSSNFQNAAPALQTRRGDLTTTENVATLNQNENVTTSNLHEAQQKTEYVKPVSEEECPREISQVGIPILEQPRQTTNESSKIQITTDVANSNTGCKIISSTFITDVGKSSIVTDERKEISNIETAEQVTSSSEESKRYHKESTKQDNKENKTIEIESRKEQMGTTQIPDTNQESESRSGANENDVMLDKESKTEKNNIISGKEDLRAQDELSALGAREIPKEPELSALDPNDSVEEEMDIDYEEDKPEVSNVAEITKIGDAEVTENASNFGPEMPEQQKELRAFKVDPEKKIIETEMVSNKDKKFTDPSVESPASIDTSEDSQFSADAVNSPASVVVNSKMRMAVNIFKETAMDGEADTSMDLPTFDTPLGTPISMLASDTNDNMEETNMSVTSTDAGPTPAKRPRQASLSSAIEELDQHIITVDRLYEYQWPQDGGEWHMLQEQVSEYLNVKSFKRKYPDMYRRFVDKEEKEFLMDRGVVTETLCDLGLTAIRSDEVFDLMYKDYPDKYQEFAAFMHGKQRQTIYEQHKEYDVPKLEKSKMADYMKKAVKSAADFNQQLQRDRKDERKAFFDMQTFNIHYPEGRYKKLPANLTKPSAYPIALIPGQFQHYYTKYTSDELKYLPINTAIFDAPKRMMPAQKVISNTSSEMEDSQEEKMASSDGETDGSSDSGSNSDAEEEKKKADPIKETTCRRCEKKNKNKKRPRKVKEEIINCSECGAGGHPTCLELTSEMVEVIQTYPWQCMECKTCVECMDPYDEDKMMFCDRCDRGYHTFCVGVKGIPTGRWECKSCKVTTETPKSRRGNRN